MKPPDLGDPARDQPRLRGLRVWDGVLVATGEAQYRIEPLADPERTRAVRVAIPGTVRVIDVAMAGDVPVAPVQAGGGLALAFW